MRNLLILAGIIVFFLIQTSYAQNPSIDIHTGYGILKFEEHENYRGDKYDSDFKHTVALLGLSGEYTFPQNEHFYTGINAEWAFGLKDRETWDRNGIEVQKNDMRLTTQFYDLRTGYKNQKDNLYYRFYILGGWEGLRFKRDNYIWQGSPLNKISIEEISLYKAGAGAGIGFKKDKWSLDGGIAYSYYADGETEDSSLPNVTFDTDGYRMNIDIGLTREITDNLSLYFGGGYQYQRLKGNTSDDDISWKTKLQILAGVINLTYAF